MTERKFTRALNKPGMAAQLRETVSQVVRESAVLVSIILFITYIHIYYLKILFIYWKFVTAFIKNLTYEFVMEFHFNAEKRVCLVSLTFKFATKFIYIHTIFMLAFLSFFLFFLQKIWKCVNMNKVYIKKDAFGKHLP